MYIPKTEDIQQFVENSINYWLEKINLEEMPEYARLKERPEFDFLEKMERHFITIGACCGVAMVTGWLKILEERKDEINPGNDGKN
jgi:hypothetical protein